MHTTRVALEELFAFRIHTPEKAGVVSGVMHNTAIPIVLFDYGPTHHSYSHIGAMHDGYVLTWKEAVDAVQYTIMGNISVAPIAECLDGKTENDAPKEVTLTHEPTFLFMQRMLVPTEQHLSFQELLKATGMFLLLIAGSDLVYTWVDHPSGIILDVRTYSRENLNFAPKTSAARM